MIGIYKIVSPSNKIYIGQSINIERRFEEYQKAYCKHQIKLYNSFQKYGVDKHQFEIIEECTAEQLDEREIYFKKHFNSVNKGLNCNYYDYSPMKEKKHTKSSCQKISIAKKGHICYKNSERGKKISKTNTGKKQSKETCFNKSKATKGKSKPEGFGEKISKLKKGKTNPKIGIARKGKPSPNKAKPIIQYNINGEYIQTHRTQAEAALFLGKSINSKESIGQCCRKIKKTAFGYIWRFKNDPISIEEINKMLVHKSKNKPKPNGFGDIISKAKKIK